jgi:hypothetical protein
VEESADISYIYVEKRMKEGLIWRVDHGMFNLWLDPWIPRGVTRRSITPKGQTLEIETGRHILGKGVQYILSTPF